MNRVSREQNLQSQMARTRMVFVLSCIAIAFAVIVGIAIWKNCFVYAPPARESNAKMGTPTPDGHYLYSGLNTDFGYQVMLAANLYRQEDGSLNIYFTNTAANEVLLLCEIVAEDSGDTLYKSGLLKPGEYVESLSPCMDFPNEATMVLVKIYAFEPKTYYSAGSTVLNVTLQAW